MAVPFVAGMMCGNCWAGHYTHLAWPLLSGLCVLVAVLIWIHAGKQSLSARLRSVWFGITVAMATFVVGAILFMHRFNQVARFSQSPSPSLVKGVVCAVPVRKTKTWAVELRRADGARVMAYVESGPKDIPPAHVGDTLLVRPVTWQSTLYDPTDSLGVYAPYRAYLFHRGIGATCYVPYNRFRIYSTWRGPTLRTWRESSLRAREHIGALYAEHGLDGRALAVVAAMTVGQRKGLTREIRQDFADAGLSHILALSGFHLSIVLSILNCLLMRLLLPLAWRRGLVLAVVPVLWAYVLLAGSPPSLVRAAVMVTVAQLCGWQGRRMGLVNALAATAIFMLCVDPFALMDVGFQLSFLSLLGIAVMGLPLIRRMPRLPWLVSFVVEIIVITLSATLFTMPLTAHHFGRLPLLGVVANIPGSVLALCIMWASVLWWLAVCLPLGQALRDVLSDVLSWLANALARWADSIGSVPHATFPCTLSWPEAMILYVLLLSAVGYVRWRSTWMAYEHWHPALLSAPYGSSFRCERASLVHRPALRTYSRRQ